MKEYLSNDCYIDMNQMCIYVKGEPKELSEMQAKVMAYLINNKGQFLSQEMIAAHYYGSEYEKDVNEYGNIRTVISAIRKIYPEVLNNAIKTKRSVGYMYKNPRTSPDSANGTNVASPKTDASENIERTSEYYINPIIANGISENGVYLSSYALSNPLEQAIDYHFDLSKGTPDGRLLEFVMLCLDVATITLSDKLNIDQQQLVFCFDYQTENSSTARMIVEFKYGERNSKCFETMVELTDTEGSIEIQLPALGNNIFDSLSEICFVLRPRLSEQISGNIKISSVQFKTM